MSEKLEDLTPNQRRALGKALAALETMASMWGVEIGLRRVSEQLAMKPEAERANDIAAFIEQAFIEGAYRHYLDRDPAANRELESASQHGGKPFDPVAGGDSDVTVGMTCPFCGGEGYLMKDGPHHWIECGNCFCETTRCQSPTGNDEAAARRAIQLWEQRYGKSAQAVASQPGGAWQPIETAPKTGRTLLLGYLNRAENWRTVRGQWMSENYISEYWEEPDEVEPGWFETSAEADDIPNCWRIEPTHWMPLPAAPSAGNGGAEGNAAPTTGHSHEHP